MENKNQTNNLKSFMRTYTPEISVFFAMILLVIIGSFLSPYFLKARNFSSISIQLSYYGVAAVGCMWVMIIGCIDVSQMAVMGISVMISGLLSTKGVNSWIIIGACLCFGIFAGLINGFLVARLKVLPMIATIGTSFIWRAVCYLINPSPLTVSDPVYKVIGYNNFLGIPVLFWIFIVFAVVIGLISALTPFGRFVRVCGSNASVSYLSGIKVVRTKFIAYMVSGFAASIAGIIWAAQLSSAYPSAGNSYELIPIASCVIGGVSLDGGRGTLAGTIIGVTVMVMLSNIIVLKSIGSYYQLLCQGIVLIGTLVLRGIIDKRNTKA